MDNQQIVDAIQKMANEYETLTSDKLYLGYRQANGKWNFYFADVTISSRAAAYNHMRQSLRYAKQRYANKIGK